VPSLKERLKPRNNLSPLLLRLEERPPEHLDYIGVSYGMTYDLLKYGLNLHQVVSFEFHTSVKYIGCLYQKHNNFDKQFSGLLVSHLGQFMSHRFEASPGL